jgi:hypothetical protein
MNKSPLLQSFGKSTEVQSSSLSQDINIPECLKFYTSKNVLAGEICEGSSGLTASKTL